MSIMHETGSPARRLLALFAGLALALPARAAPQVQGELADMTIEELANIQVTSVSKKPERLIDAPASVYVITAEDIRRSGAATLPEVLRLAPNLQVAQTSNETYSITARGMNGSSNSPPNKLLVLVDGRSVYTPLFSGVFWDAQDVLLEDVERIEVISGPGGTLWGVNAVTGVINITTRSAHQTSGTLALARAASDGADAALRYGATSGTASWRVVAKTLVRSHNELASGAPVNDGWHQSQLGFRADWERGADRFGVNANAYRGKQEQPEPGLINVPGSDQRLGTIRTEGANLTAHWQRLLDDGGTLGVQAYLDYTRREVPPSFTESLDIADLQLQHSLPALGAHSVVWGVNYRHSRDRVTNSDIVAFLPADDRQAWSSVFAQDEIGLSDKLRLTVGARVERNPYTGSEWLPTARLAYKPAAGHALWASASRTVRAPSRIDVDAFVPGQPPYIVAGGPLVRSEVARVYEMGYRGQPAAGLSYSLALFHNDYDHLRTVELLPSGTALAFASLMEGTADGVEAWGSYQVTEQWRLSAGFTALRERFRLKPGSNSVGDPATSGFDPAHTAQLRSSYSFDDRRELEVAVRNVGALAIGPVSGYTAVDARFGWWLSRELELSVSGQNLNGSHAEFGPVGTRMEVPRRVAVKLVWRR
ncbi:TonB-dependent receptor [Massilia solisilvae]|uniref:TonB-dependent receptor n=1 Tax=Massilia solisilvae TaxID=1811225 RepID=A0ABT2BKX9_9BURK|nr:TonB-dependent receptor [Massilia solisilvae]MCS0609169.1 TonB-dependent receptor [Massilia solisilvae]